MATATQARTTWRFTVDDYYRMAEVGILPRDARVELIEGEIVAMSPIGSLHGSCVKRLNRLLATALGPRAILSVQDPVRLDDGSEPQPDVAVLHPRPDFYRSGHATPGEVFWLIEVMDSSAPFDRGTKLPLYARSGISEVWLVDLNGEFVEVHRLPVEGRYDEPVKRSRGESIAPEAFPDVVLSVDSILGEK